MSYNLAFLTALEDNVDGSAGMVFTHTGNAGEPARIQRIPFVTDVDTDADTVRRLVIPFQTKLNKTRNFLIGAQPAIGTQVDTTTALPADPASTYGMFCAASAPFTPGATPQDVFAITGSATRRVEIQRIGISTVQTTAGINAWLLRKRSTANSGGTSALVTGVPTDDSYPAATATVRQYTANPTAGTIVGNVWSGRVPSPAPATVFAGPSDYYVGNGRGSIATLTGTGDVLAWNLNGVALPSGLSVQASVWWTES